MLHFVFAKRGGGKTEFCLNQLKAAYDSNQKAALLIPEQLSLDTESKVISKVGVIGGNIEVFSFNRLFRRVYSHTNRPKREYMDDVGKIMLINRILETDAEDFIILKPGKGANSSLLSTVTEFKRHFADAEKLKNASELFSSNLSKQKFSEFALLLSRYDYALSDSNADSSDNLTILPELISVCDSLDGFSFYIDGFDGFTPQETAVICALSKRLEVYVTLTQSDNRTQLFSPVTATAKKLRDACDTNQISYDEKFLPEFSNKIAPALLYLKENFSNWYAKPFTSSQSSIHIFATDTPYSEVDALSRRILNLTKQGLRLKDIVVCVPDTNSYLSIIEKSFSDYNLPFFADRRETISSHPLCRFLICLCDLFVQNFSRTAVFSFLKNEFCPIPLSETDALQFYVSETGIQGASNWQSEWKNAPEGYDLELLNKTREKFLSLVSPFREKTKGKTAYSVFSDALIEFLKQIKADEHINLEIPDLSKEETSLEVNVWNSVLNVINQLKITFGDSTVGIEKIKNALTAGFSCCTVGKIPPTLDHVTITTSDRGGLTSSKVLFILGATEGAFPGNFQGSGMITDTERTVLSENGIELSQTNRQKALNSPFSVYMTLTMPTELLCISYPIESKSGEGTLPSSVISDLKRMFPGVEIKTELNLSDSSVISTPKATLPHFLKRFENGGLWEQVYGWYLENPEWKFKINRYLSSKKYTLSWRLKKQTAEALWGKTLYTSISRLEKFASCPLSFFLTYGLKLKKIEEHTFSPPEAGNMMHTVMENFVKEAIDKNLDWNTLSFEDTKQKTLVLCDEVIAKQTALFPSVSKRYSFLLSRIKTSTVNAMWAVVHHIQAGVFKPVCTELEFKGENSPVFVTDKGNTLVLSGKIDRIDASADGYRIIDYKSSKKELDLSAVMSGRSLQLPIYSYALKDKFGKPKGMFYLAVEPKLLERTIETSDSPDEKLIKEYKLSGYTIGDDKDILSMDMNIKGHSSVISASNFSTGIKSKALLSDSEYTSVEDMAIKKAKEFGDAILDGDYPILPVETEHTLSCERCDFKSVCRFDSAYCSSKKESNLTDDELLGREADDYVRDEVDRRATESD